jgi:CheY-like chemotaxis protein
MTAVRSAGVIVTGILLATGTDGVELIVRLRRDERTSQAPIIVLTACAWNTERERAERGLRCVVAEAVAAERSVAPRTAVARRIEAATCAPHASQS